jgi:hypothetical protein
MTATTLSAPTIRPRTRTTTQLWKAGLGAGVVASGATVVTAGIARAADVPLTVGGEAIPLWGFAQLTMIGTIVGVVLATALGRWARRPRHTFVVTTVMLTALSIVPDITADASTATRVVLALTHVVAAAIVIPAVTRRLAD